MEKKLTIFLIASLIIILSVLLCSCSLLGGRDEDNDKPTEIPFEIVKTPMAKEDVVYTGSSQALIEPGEVVGGIIEYWLDDGKPHRYTPYTDKVPTATNAGEYKVYYAIHPYNTNKETIKESIICTIKKAQPVVIEEPQPIPDCQYWISGKVLFTEGKANGGKFVFSKTKDGGFSRNVDFYQLGENTVFYKIQGDENHLDSEVKSATNTLYPREIDFTNQEKGGIIDIVDKNGNETEEEYVYIGEKIEPNIKVKFNGGWNEVPCEEYEVLYENNIDAGTAKIIVRDVAGGNYIVNGEKEFTIKKIPFNNENLPKVNKLFYNGKPQELVTNGTAEGWTFLYSNQKNGEYTKNLPTGIAAGNYEIWCKVEGDKNHEGKKDARSFYISIGKAEATGTECTAKENLVYSGKEQELIDVGTLVGGKFLFSMEEYGAFSETIPTKTNAGTYKVYVKKEADDNYCVQNDNYYITTTIGKAESSATIAKKALTYSGQEMELLTANTVLGGTLQYKIGEGEYSNNIPKAKQAGEYHVFYKLTGDNNHKDIEEKEVVCKIDPKQINVATEDIILSNDVMVYTGSEITPIIVGNIKDGNTIILSSEYEIVYENNINAGTAKIIVRDVAGGNYIVNGEKEFTIEKASIALELAPVPIVGNVFDGLSKTLIVAGIISGGEQEQTLQYKIAVDGTYSKNIPSATDAGEYKVYYQVPEGKNHKGIAEAFVTAKIFGVTYTLCADGTSYSADGHYDISLTEVTIPSTFNNKPIVAIGNNAFSNCTNLTKLVIPDSVKAIGDNAFSGCTNLTKLVIPDSVTTIGNNAFSGCTNLTNLVLSKAVTSIGSNAFSGCNALMDITCPIITLEYLNDQNKEHLNTVVLTSGTEIKANIFSTAGQNISKLVIPDSVTTIGNNAFSACSNLQEVSCPAMAMPYIKEDNLKVVNITSGTELPKNAFTHKGPLDKLVIADSIQTMDYNAFPSVGEQQGYVVIKELIAPEIGLKIVEKYIDKNELQKFTLTNGTKLPKNIFWDFINLTTVNLPDTLQSIEDTVFCGCTALKEIIIPNGVTSIGWGVFKDCNSLMTLSVPFLGETENSADYNFLGYTFGTSDKKMAFIPRSLKNLSINRGKIANGSIGRCLEDKVGVTNFTDNNIISVTIGAGVTEIEAGAFISCPKLKEVCITDLNAWFNIIFNDNPLIIAKHLYLNGQEVETLDISVNVPANAFSGCKSLKTITIGDNIAIGENAFNNCSNISGLSIGKNATIPTQAFFGCTGITSLTIGKNATIDDTAFWECSASLQTITLGENAKYKVENNCLINKENNTLVLGSNGVSVIPNGVVTIENYAFYGCQLDSITIPNSVTTISDSAFNYSKLSSIVLPNSVSSVGEHAFEGCTNLRKVTIGTAVTLIGCDAFKDCQIEEVYIFDLKKWCEIDFKNEVSNPLYRQINGKLYLDNEPLSIIVIPKGITTLKANTFQGACYLTKIHIGNDVKEIEDYALEYCKNLSEVIVNNTVSLIGSSIFMDCTSMTKLEVPFIGKNAVAKDTVVEEADQHYYNLAYLFTQKTIIDIGYNKLDLSVTGDTKIVSNALQYAICLKEVHISINVTKVDDYGLDDTAKKDKNDTDLTHPGVCNFYYDGTIEQWQNIGGINNVIVSGAWRSECYMNCSDGKIRYYEDENGWPRWEKL